MKLTHTVVICSRAREDVLVSCIRNLCAADEFENVCLIIVLNGLSQEEYERSRHHLVNLRLGNLTVAYSSPGLAAARNLALHLVKSEIVTFLDDDVEIPIDFFSVIDEEMASNSKISGLSPSIKGSYLVSLDGSLKTRIKRIYLSRVYGKITRFGENYWIPDSGTIQSEPVDWLPGCSMTYRTSRIINMTFDTGLMNGPTGGYSLGEDVAFSSKVGNLFSIPRLTVNHLQAPSIRDNNFRMAKARGRWIAYLARNKGNDVSVAVSLLWMLFRLGVSAAKDASNPSNKLVTVRGAALQIHYFILELIKPKLVDEND